MGKKEHKKTIIVQGGGFRTGFSTGVLDAFQTVGYNDFELYVGVSGGSIALSYFLSEQYQKCFDAMCLLAEDPNFLSFNRMIWNQAIMDIDYFHEVAAKLVPFEIEKALANAKSKELAFVMTNRNTGEPHYYHPNKKTWTDAVIASCTLPFVTKGKHSLQGVEYMDGGWSDPLPVEWAYNNGSREMLVVRTSPVDLKANQSWSDYFGTFVFRSNENLKNCFEHNHQKYNDSIEFLNNPPKDLKINQIAPDSPLRAGTHSNSVSAITADYRHGVQAGLDFIHRIKNGNL